MFIDLFGEHTKSGVPIYTEVQIGEIDLVHLSKVQRIIDSIDNGIILWIAGKMINSFNERLKEQITHNEHSHFK